MKLGLFIANLETLRATHGADLEVIGALVDVAETGEVKMNPHDDTTAIPYTAYLSNDAPVYLLMPPPESSVCPYCGGNH